jgi:hypothetical protein
MKIFSFEQRHIIFLVEIDSNDDFFVLNLYVLNAHEASGIFDGLIYCLYC